MKLNFETPKQAPPLKLIGKRALISLEMLPFMHMLSPLALTLTTLRNPKGLKYSRKIFNDLKKALLKRTFKRNFLKNEQKMKFLIRGYELLKREKQFEENSTLISTKPVISERFNLNSVKEWFDSITNSSRASTQMNFIESIPRILEKRRQFEYRACMKLKKTINDILEHERTKEYEKCEEIYHKKFVGLTIPWTENVFKEVEEFGKNLWDRYLNNELVYDSRKRPKVAGKKQKKKAIRK